MGHQILGRHTAFDQMGWSPGLGHTIRAGSAGIFGTTGDDDPELGRDHIEPLRYILADTMQSSATGADQTVWLDHFLDPWQMFWQGPAIGRTAFLACGLCWGEICLIGGMNHSNGCLQILKSHLELIGISLLRLATKESLLEGLDQRLKLGDPFILADAMRLAGNHQRLQGGNIIGKIGFGQYGQNLADFCHQDTNNIGPESS